MEAHMDPSNCVGLYHWARGLGATSLADGALRYICQHFTQVGINNKIGLVNNEVVLVFWGVKYSFKHNSVIANGKPHFTFLLCLCTPSLGRRRHRTLFVLLSAALLTFIFTAPV